ncbi:MAG TPA: AAA family ATPase [Thermoanaerobaculia bacterium]|nr:AAA family ATPase [Thermoanaerobaculia bacterium]
MSSPGEVGAALDRVMRVFVSSTFRDMRAERDELVKQVFPRLRRRCERRGVVWGEVDLRWGITDEQKAEGEVLPRCLAQIRGCRPYFLGLLGQRYGWVPLEIDDELVAREPWLAEHRGRSVTELEILHGVLNDPGMAEHAFFYFRSPSYLDTLPGEERDACVEGPTPEEIAQLGAEAAERRAEQRRQNLRALAQRIRASGLPVRDYPHPRALGELVARDLEAVIDRRFPRGSEPPPRDREAAAHQAFVASRARVYIARQEDFARLDAHAAGDGPPLAVVSEPGLGKSALLANWMLRWQADRPRALVLGHFVGASPESSDWAAMLRRLLGELARHRGVEVEPGPAPPATAEGASRSGAEALRLAFANALFMAAEDGPVVLVLDGLDQLDDRDGALDLAWLPERPPPGVRVLMATRAGRPLEEVRRRGWPALDVAPLAPPERERLIAEYLALYAKALSPARVARIAGADAAGSPLYLRLLLEELRQWGDHERLDERLAHYLAASGPVELYKRVLERFAEDYERDRPDLVEEAMSLLWGARRGLAEAELLELLAAPGEPLAQGVWTPLFLAAEAGLQPRGGLLAFAHQALRQAVERAFIGAGAARRRLHLRLADYFAARPPSPRRLDELPWQLAAAGEWTRLAGLLAEPAVLAELWQRAPFDVKGYWARVEAASEERLVASYAPILSRPDEHVVVLPQLAALLFDTVHLDECGRLREVLVEGARQTAAGRALAAALGALAQVRWAQGRLADAEHLREEQERAARQAGDGTALRDALGGRALLLAARAENEAALELQVALEGLCREAGDARGLALSLGNQAAILGASDGGEEALAKLDELERLARERGDRDLLARAMGLRGAAHQTLGERGAAGRAYREQEEACRGLGAWDGVVSSLNNRAAVLFERDLPEQALPLAAEAAAIARRIGWKHGEHAAVLNLAQLHADLREDEEARARYAECETLSRELGDGLTEAMCWLGQARLLVREERYRDAFDLYERAAKACGERAAAGGRIEVRDGMPLSAAAGYVALHVRTFYEHGEALGKAHRFADGYALVEEGNRLAERHGLPSIASAAREGAAALRAFADAAARRRPPN